MAITKGQRRAHSQLDALYDQVPALACKGRCAFSCMNGVGMSAVERDRIAETTDVELPEVTSGACAALDNAGRCSVYDWRPMVCRLWGAAETMECPHGCLPLDGGPLLSHGEAMDLLVASQQVVIGSGPEARRERAALGVVRSTVDTQAQKLLPLLIQYREGDPGAGDRLREAAAEAFCAEREKRGRSTRDIGADAD
jgi:Fe-S-cluster containining protein